VFEVIAFPRTTIEWTAPVTGWRLTETPPPNPPELFPRMMFPVPAVDPPIVTVSIPWPLPPPVATKIPPP
jgi:hypothetical protein